jgi:hypothetical protein
LRLADPSFAEAGAVRRSSAAIRRKPLSVPLVPMYRDAVLTKGAIVNLNNSYQWRKQLMWGLLLVGLGGALLLDQMDMLDIYDLWHYWPLILVVIGINKMIGYPTANDFTSGLWICFIGVWLFANFERMFGMTFHNSWPYLIIAWGVTLILKPFIRERFAVNAPAREASHEE